MLSTRLLSALSIYKARIFIYKRVFFDKIMSEIYYYHFLMNLPTKNGQAQLG